MKIEKNRWVVYFLNMISMVFKSISFLNLKIKSLRQKKYNEVLIVSVDNLSFGGTGKTTLITRIGKHLQNERIKFAVISRGYRGKYEKEGAAAAPHHSAAAIGDEAKLLKTEFPDQDIFIGKNRHKSINQAIRANNRVLIIDDGFQSTDIYKDIKIMLYNPYHSYYYLRNFKFLMKGEDYILFYEPPGAPGEKKSLFKKTGTAAIGSYFFEKGNFYDVKGNIVDVGGAVLFAFSGLGDNHRFESDLSEFNLAGFRHFRDHYSFTENDIQSLDNKRKELKADYLVCTKKDFIKLVNFNLANIPLIFAQNVIKCNINLSRIILNNAAQKKANEIQA